MTGCFKLKSHSGTPPSWKFHHWHHLNTSSTTPGNRTTQFPSIEPTRVVVSPETRKRYLSAELHIPHPSRDQTRVVPDRTSLVCVIHNSSSFFLLHFQILQKSPFSVRIWRIILLFHQRPSSETCTYTTLSSLSPLAGWSPTDTLFPPTPGPLDIQCLKHRRRGGTPVGKGEGRVESWKEEWPKTDLRSRTRDSRELISRRFTETEGLSEEGHHSYGHSGSLIYWKSSGVDQVYKPTIPVNHVEEKERGRKGLLVERQEWLRTPLTSCRTRTHRYSVVTTQPKPINHRRTRSIQLIEWVEPNSYISVLYVYTDCEYHSRISHNRWEWWLRRKQS